MYKNWLLALMLLVIVSASVWAEPIDLSKAKIVVLDPDEKVMANAGDMLADEIEKRTRIALDVVSKMPKKGQPAIILGVVKDVTKKLSLPTGLELPGKAEGFAIWTDTTKRSAATVCLAGVDKRGVLYAVGKVLREMDLTRDSVVLDSDLKISTAPVTQLRGHQIGYRPKTNAYDAWDIEIWEQYYRDMIAYGANAVEFVPPESDDKDDSSHFPKRKIDMLVAQSQLADDYDLDVWIWYPVVDDDDLNERAISKALKVREEVFQKMPRVDVIFVPGGDPGEVYPDQLFALMERLKKSLNKYHPDGEVWVSPQGFDHDGDAPGYLKVFYEQMDKEPDWLGGVVYGPQVAPDLKELRERLPKQYPIRRYPDITHCLDAQYQVPNWDSALHSTLYREPINPRPRAYTKIFTDWDQYTCGYITYSEGVNDDVNKFIWSCLGWDPETKVEDILKDYSKYFIGPEFEDSFAQGLLGLEENWQGSLLGNIGVYKTLGIFQEMERRAMPKDKLNWRFQLALYRAYYDAYIRRRLIHETELEEQAIEALLLAKELGSLKAIVRAETILAQAETSNVGAALKARVYEMAEALFQSIRMQLSVEKYYATSVRRGANLNTIDTRLNNTRELKKLFARVRILEDEDDRLELIKDITMSRYQIKIDHDRKVIADGEN